MADLLILNAGSSSLKLAVYDDGAALTIRARVVVDRIGRPETECTLTTPSGSSGGSIEARDHRAALIASLNRLRELPSFNPAAVGHRIVLGGPNHAAPLQITAQLVAELRALAPMDPTHMPQALSVVESARQCYPGVPHVACFDTAFHRSMPPVAQRYPLPARLLGSDVRRYGFHGLSCESIVAALERLGPGASGGRLIIAHLGNGASMTAVRDGASVDTTMGFSPCGGLMMGTRSGDLDPTVVTYLARSGRGAIGDLEQTLNERSGLLGVSETSADMRDLLASGAPQALEAIALFCYIARKQVGALAAVLDGLDLIVFTGGIGEHAAPIRERICAGLAHLGVQLDRSRNLAQEPVISTARSAVAVRVMATDEEAIIAAHVRRVVA